LGDDIDPYIWHHTENSTNTHEGTLKEFSSSVIGLKDFKKNKVLKIIQILKLDNLTPDERQQYYRSEETRRSNASPIKSDYEKSFQLGQVSCQEINRRNIIKVLPEEGKQLLRTVLN
jgi:hypothetical protein